jgi:hypothetical protein
MKAGIACGRSIMSGWQRIGVVISKAENRSIFDD